VDVVFHLAARVHVMNEFAEDPLSEFRKVVSGNRLSICIVVMAAMAIIMLLALKFLPDNLFTYSGTKFPLEDAAQADINL
jgi:hypothetical protein